VVNEVRILKQGDSQRENITDTRKIRRNRKKKSITMRVKEKIGTTRKTSLMVISG